jgi:hypothetical protein
LEEGDPNAIHLHAGARGRFASRAFDVLDRRPELEPGDTIPLGKGRILRVIEIRPGPGPEDDPVLVVEAA